jgi:BASS family bile acid:Na+ symporter
MSKKAWHTFYRVCLCLSAASFIAFIGAWIAGHSAQCAFLPVSGMIVLTVGLSGVSSLKGYRFTASILAAVAAAMIYPGYFSQIAGINLQDPRLILFVVQLVMFGMGTQMSIDDFIGVVKMPKAVLIGTASQYTIMPLVGYILAKTIGFPPEIAAGIILIGSCSSGLASNVMVYLAGANLALSVTLVALAQLLAPVLTPLWMRILAGALVQINFFAMMRDIVYMVVMPIFIAMLYNKLRKGRLKSLHSYMPVISMCGIIYFTAVTTAAGRDHLLQIGAMLVLAAILHNSAGYFLGYWGSRLSGLDIKSCRTVAIEVGLQNGGMASGIAGRMGKLATVGLAAAIFSPWMNVSGSVLANYWRRRPPI